MLDPPPRRSFLRRLLSRAAGNFLYSASIDLIESNRDRVVLSVAGRPFSADAITREISSEGKVVARFDAVQAVAITQLVVRGGTVWWMLNLALRDRRAVFVGRTAGDVEASIAAARLGTILGVDVRAPAAAIGD